MVEIRIIKFDNLTEKTKFEISKYISYIKSKNKEKKI